jgi:archaellum component FlaC
LFDADEAFTKTIGTIQGSIRDLDSEVDQLRTDVNGRIDTIVGTDLSKITQDIQGLKDTDAEHDKSIESLNKSVTSLNTTVTGTNGHASRIQALEQAS